MPPVTATDPLIVNVTVPDVVKTLDPVKTNVATLPVTVPVVKFNIFVDKVNEASAVKLSLPLLIFY